MMTWHRITARIASNLCNMLHIKDSSASKILLKMEIKHLCCMLWKLGSVSLDHHQSYPAEIFFPQFDTSIRIKKGSVQYLKDIKGSISQHKIWLAVILVLCSAILIFIHLFIVAEERKHCGAMQLTKQLTNSPLWGCLWILSANFFDLSISSNQNMESALLLHKRKTVSCVFYLSFSPCPVCHQTKLLHQRANFIEVWF